MPQSSIDEIARLPPLPNHEKEPGAQPEAMRGCKAKLLKQQSRMCTTDRIDVAVVLNVHGGFAPYDARAVCPSWGTRHVTREVVEGAQDLWAEVVWELSVVSFQLEFLHADRALAPTHYTVEDDILLRKQLVTDIWLNNEEDAVLLHPNWEEQMPERRGGKDGRGEDDEGEGKGEGEGEGHDASVVGGTTGPNTVANSHLSLPQQTRCHPCRPHRPFIALVLAFVTPPPLSPPLCFPLYWLLSGTALNQEYCGRPLGVLILVLLDDSQSSMRPSSSAPKLTMLPVHHSFALFNPVRTSTVPASIPCPTMDHDLFGYRSVRATIQTSVLPVPFPIYHSMPLPLHNEVPVVDLSGHYSL
ncbi:hypothetical protein WOLCODRAFT_156157 [Wolfiporia cocos MD-104 SS10]|uniref:Uncharacterized protein n=1 Tax=Wolfiporia cocos (strain MD-104) TaxID=742152 RepID=A0A2H3IZW0_WOLCO|nr:hypothetical protein WOLCODRAFT_156157 [Wolfiporia cocos MD-104 SS10]